MNIYLSVCGRMAAFESPCLLQFVFFLKEAVGLTDSSEETLQT